MPARTIYLVKRLETEITTRMTQILGEKGLTPAQFTILSFVGNSDMDLSSAQLSRRFFMTPQSMNEVVNTLQQKELLERDTDPNHKRILRIRLTGKGQETLQWCNEAMDRFESDFFEGLEGDALEAFRGFMEEILLKNQG